MASIRPYLSMDQNRFRADTSRHWEEFVCKVSTNSSSGLGGDAIMMKIKDGCPRPYLSTDRNHFQACTTRPLGEHLRQVSKKSDQWSWRRCDNEIVTVLSNGQNLTSGLRGEAIMRLLQCWVKGKQWYFKYGRQMATIWPYLLTDWNCFRADTERNSYARFWQNSSSGFEGDATLVKIKVGHWRPYLAMDQNHIPADTTRPLGVQLGQV